jgi:hypothetical protein
MDGNTKRTFAGQFGERPIMAVIKLPVSGSSGRKADLAHVKWASTEGLSPST